MKEIKRLTLVLTVFIALLGLVALGCNEGAEAPEGDEAVTTDTGDEAATGEDDDFNLQATLAIDDISTGTELSADGSIDTGNTTNEFNVGDTVFVAMEVGDATAGSTVEVVWYGPDGMEAGSDSKNVELDQHYMNFEIPTDGWAMGTYRGEVWYNNEMMDEFELEIGTGEAAEYEGGDDA